MNKVEIAAYLASLNSLLESQDAAGGHTRSQIVGAEFEKYWNLFKSELVKEHENEARRRKLIENGRNETSDSLSHSQSGCGSSDRESDAPGLFSQTGNIRDGSSGSRS